MDSKTQTNIRLTEEERRALRVLAAALGVSAGEWTSQAIQREWRKMFPGKAYPDEQGRIRELPREDAK